MERRLNGRRPENTFRHRDLGIGDRVPGTWSRGPGDTRHQQPEVGELEWGRVVRTWSLSWSRDIGREPGVRTAWSQDSLESGQPGVRTAGRRVQHWLGARLAVDGRRETGL